MKKILIFSLAYFPHVSGAELAVREVTDRIAPEEIEFHMVTLRFSKDEKKEEKIGNVLVHRVGGGATYFSKILFIPRAAVKAARLHKKNKFDAWWALMSYMVLPIVLLRLRGLRLPYALTLQDGDPFAQVFNRPLILPFRPFLKMGFKNATVVQVISNYLAQWPKKMGYAGSVVVIPNGADTEVFSKTSKEGVQKVENMLNKKPGDIFLITTSRLVRKNAIDVCIRALALLPEHVFFIIVGDGQDKQQLQELALTLQLAARVHFVGAVENKKLPAYLHAADIFVRPSRSEGMGTSFVEAMAAGLPVVATQVGGITDFLFDIKKNPQKPPTGFAVAVDSPQEIAQAVQEIISNPDHTQQVIQNAHALVAEKYDWSLIAKDMHEKVFNQLFC